MGVGEAQIILHPQYHAGVGGWGGGGGGLWAFISLFSMVMTKLYASHLLQNLLTWREKLEENKTTNHGTHHQQLSG